MNSQLPASLLANLSATMMLLSIIPASAQDLRDISRAQVDIDIRQSSIGAGYAQMLNFFVDPSISASRLDADDGTQYDVFKLPLQYEIPANDDNWLLAVRGTLSHASAENTFSLIEGETIDGTWDATSAQLGVGLIIPAGERLSWLVAGQFGVSRLENEADYNGERSRETLPALLDGVLFNWDTNATIAGLTAGLDYKRRLASQYDLDIAARYTYSRIASYSESQELSSFSEDTGVLSVTADLDHPWNVNMGELSMFGTLHLGATTFTGPNRKALGFSHFYMAGYSVGLNVAETNRYFEAFSVGAHANFGSDVDGYSLRFAWRLK